MRHTTFALAIVLALAVAACGERTPIEMAHIDYLRTCSLCHGAQGQGMGNLGNSLVDNDFIRSRSDDELVAFIKRGRAPSDPDNRSGVAMPPKGGDPRLTDEDLHHIVLLLRQWSPPSAP